VHRRSCECRFACLRGEAFCGEPRGREVERTFSRALTPERREMPNPRQIKDAERELKKAQKTAIGYSGGQAASGDGVT
jgi:hypothetical protein